MLGSSEGGRISSSFPYVTSSFSFFMPRTRVKLFVLEVWSLRAMSVRRTKRLIVEKLMLFFNFQNQYLYHILETIAPLSKIQIIFPLFHFFDLS